MDVSLTQRHYGTKNGTNLYSSCLCVRRSGNVTGLHIKSITTSLSEKLRSVGF